MSKIRYYKTKEVAEITEVGRDRFVQWVYKLIIVPAVPSPGRGRAAMFSIENLLEVKLIECLFQVGFPLQEAARLTVRLLSSDSNIQSVCLSSSKRSKTLPCKLALTVHMRKFREELLEDIRRYDEKS